MFLLVIDIHKIFTTIVGIILLFSFIALIFMTFIKDRKIKSPIKTPPKASTSPKVSTPPKASTSPKVSTSRKASTSSTVSTVSINRPINQRRKSLLDCNNPIHSPFIYSKNDSTFYY